MIKPIAFMFSGQGSHYFHMGREFYENEPIFKKWMLKIDDIAYASIGESVIDYLYSSQRKKSNLFNELAYSHPAIFMVEYSMARVFMEKNIPPDLIIGASLGEFIGAAISGAVCLTDALKMIIEQVKAFKSTCKKGRMIAILDNPDIFHKEASLHEHSELTSINFNTHFVISTEIEKLNRIESFLSSKSINYQVLPVDYGFHSSLISPAKSRFLEMMSQIKFNDPKIPLVSCVNGRIINKIDGTHFWEVIRKPIQFQRAIQHLEQKDSYAYVDLGPSGTLSTFVKYLLPQTSTSEGYSVMPLLNKEMASLESVLKYLSRTRKNNKEKTMLTYVFPGQGSQKKQMGNNLFDKYPDLTAKADVILKYSIKELCINDPDDNLSQTQYTQPALFTVNALMYYNEIEQSGRKPDYVAGHSLGEYNALLAAGVIDFETGLKLVQKRGSLMSRAKGGGMAAVIGLDEGKINQILTTHNLTNLSIANYNTPSQIVIAGPNEDILDAKSKFEASGARMYMPLRVSGAFHTSYMEAAIDEFTSFIDNCKFSPPQIPVVSNLEARPYSESKIKSNLIKQITHSVKWTETIRYLMGKGDMEFIEIGPGNALTGLIAKIKNEAKPLVINEPEEYEEEVAPLSSQEKEPKTLSEKTSPETVDKAPKIYIDSLGSQSFKKEYNLKYAYLAGAMYKGIASKEVVVRMARAGLKAFLGTGGMDLEWIEDTIIALKNELNQGKFGLNLLHSPMEDNIIDLYLKHDIHHIEASAYLQITPALVRYRLTGLSQNGNGAIHIKNKIMAKISRPEVAEVFLSPPPERIINILLQNGQITPTEAGLATKVPMTDAICVEADSGGHTDQRAITTLFPPIRILVREMKQKHGYPNKIYLGAAGGIGTPEAAASAFILGADFILTGSINQCTVEAGTSDIVKDMLQNINVQDTDYATAGDMFELGAKVQVLRKGVFFPARAKKLFSIYQNYNSIDELDKITKKQLQEKFFKKSFDDIYSDCKAYYPEDEITKAEENPKYKMSLILKWYFEYSTQLALSGNEKDKVNFQVHCGPALGSFNQWVKGTELEDWRNRHVDVIADKLMVETANLLNHRFKELGNNSVI